MEAGYVAAAETRLWVRRWGEPNAPSVLYWHGGGGSGDELPRIAPALAAAGYAVYGPDAPGYGRSSPLEPEAYRASSVAAVAGALIDALGIAPTVWVGFSWGGTIGIHAAATSPERIRALALLDGGYLMPQDDPSYDASLDFRGRIEAWRAELERQEDQDEAPIEVVAVAMAGSNVEPALPLLPKLAAADIPVLLVAATQPPEWNDIRARRIEQLRAVLPRAEVVRVQAGHGVLQEAGDEVVGVLLDWLSRAVSVRRR